VKLSIDKELKKKFLTLGWKADVKSFDGILLLNNKKDQILVYCNDGKIRFFKGEKTPYTEISVELFSLITQFLNNNNIKC